MLKFQTAKRGLSLWSRVPASQIAHLAARNGPETVHIQLVRIPVQRRTRIARYTAATVAVAYAVYKLRHVEVEERRGKGEQSQHGEDLLDNMEATLLLQVPIGLPHPQPRTYYKGSDPEWQAFKRIAQDKAAERRIHQDLVKTVRGNIAKGVALLHEKRLGEMIPDKGKFWLTTIFPDGPPPEYLTRMFCLYQGKDNGKEFFAIGTEDRLWDQGQYAHFMGHLMPTPIVKALYADIKARTSKSWTALRSTIGLEDATKQKNQSPAALLAAPALPLRPNSPASATSASATPSSDSTRSSPATTTSPQQSFAPVKAPPSTPEEKLRELLPTPASTALDTRDFLIAWAKNRRPLKTEVPRGSFAVKGWVEIEFTEALITMEVTGFYNPAKGVWENLQYLPVIGRQRHQNPKGGH